MRPRRGPMGSQAASGEEQPAGGGLAMLIKLGASLVRGIDPHDAADQIDRATIARGGSPRVVWTTVHRLAVERLAKLGEPCGCASAELPESSICLRCGGQVGSSRRSLS